jgi:hypothetical protein
MTRPGQHSLNTRKGIAMSTTQDHTTTRVSFKTVITDDTTGQILAIWFSLNPRCDDDRRAIGLDLGAVLSNGLDKLKGAIAERQFDNQFEAQHVRAAAHVAFMLAFVTRLNPDDESTLTSKSRKKMEE